MRALPKIPTMPFSIEPGTILGYRKDGRPIFPIMGASEPPGQGQQQQDPPGQQQQDPPGQQQQNTGPVEATDEQGNKLGFPANTRVEDMTDAQKASYWRNQAKVQQKRVPSNLEQLQRDAQAWAEYQRTQQSPADQQIEAAKNEARQQALREAAEDSSIALLRVTLQARGKTDEEIDELVEFVSPSRFLTQDSKVDTTKVTAYADRIVPAASAGGGGGLPGQGRREQANPDRGAAGKTEAERRGFKPAQGSYLLPKK